MQLAKGQLVGAERVDLQTFCSRGSPGAGEYLHMKWDKHEGKVALFRSVGEPGDGDWIRVDLSDVRVRFHNDRRPTGVYLTSDQAETAVAFLDRLRAERSPATMQIDYWSANNSDMIEDAGLDQESLFLSYRTESGRKNRVGIHNPYKTRFQMMGKFD